MTEDQIKHMVNRFLCWKLPENFNPDAGISFKAAFNEHTAHPMKHEPCGTNLFDATQADAMVRHMIAEMPVTPNGWTLVPIEPTREMVAAAFDAVDHVGNALIRAAEGGFSSGVICVYVAMLDAARAAISSHQRAGEKP